jgi:hypothetical protein
MGVRDDHLAEGQDIASAGDRQGFTILPARITTTHLT